MARAPASEEPDPAFSGRGRHSGAQLVRNTLSGYASVGISLITGLLLTPLILATLGPRTFGTYILATATVGYIGLVEAGVGTTSVRLITHSIASGDTVRLRQLLGSATRLYSALSALTAVAVCALVLAPSSLLTSKDQSANLRFCLIAAGIAQIFNLLTQPSVGILVGCGRLDLAVLRGIAVSAVSAALQTAVLLSGGGLKTWVSLITAVSLASSLLILPLAKRALPEVRPRWSDGSVAAVAKLFSESWRQGIANSAGSVSYVLDPIVIGTTLGPAAVSAYTLANRATAFVKDVAVKGSDALLAAYANARARQDLAREGRLFLAAVWTSGVIATTGAVVLIGLRGPLLATWLGEVPTGTREALLALSLVLVLQIPGHNAFVVLSATGGLGVLLRVAPAALLVNLPLSIFFTHVYGVAGPALGSLAVVAVVDFVILPVAVLRRVSLPASTYVRTILLLIPGGVASACVVVTARVLHATADNVSVLLVALMAAAIGPAVHMVTGGEPAALLRARLLQPRLRRRRRAAEKGVDRRRC